METRYLCKSFPSRKRFTCGWTQEILVLTKSIMRINKLVDGVIHVTVQFQNHAMTNHRMRSSAWLYFTS